MAETENTPVKKDEGVKIEDEVPELEPTGDEPPALENAPAPGEEAADAKGGKQSRSEKKSRKEMQKLKLKPVPGIIRVTVKKSKNVSFFFTTIGNHPMMMIPNRWGNVIFIYVLFDQPLLI